MSGPDLVVEQPSSRLLVISGLDGDPRLLRAAAPSLFQDLRVLEFDHRDDLALDGVDGLAERALSVLDEDAGGAAPAYICGESFGGTIALTLARRYPERVRGLILLSAFGWYPTVHARPRRAGMKMWDLIGDRAAALVLKTWRPFSLPVSLGFGCPANLARAYLDRPYLNVAAYRAKCEIALDFDARGWLGHVACPAFILTGDSDSIVPTSAGQELAGRLPNARLERLPGSHLVHLIRPTETGALISKWMREDPF